MNRENIQPENPVKFGIDRYLKGIIKTLLIIMQTQS